MAKVSADDIKAALAKLDPANDEHWTTDGLPRLDAIEALVGSAVARKDITNAAPEFTRGVAQSVVDEARDEETAGPTDEDDPLGDGAASADPQSPGSAQPPEGDASNADEGNDFETAEADPAERKAALDAKIEQLENELIDFDAGMAKARAYREDLETRVTRLRDLRQQEFPPMSPAEAIQAYQQRELEKRAAARGAMSALTKSPLDQSLTARRRPRGMVQ